jgi:hypothetical protein
MKPSLHNLIPFFSIIQPTANSGDSLNSLLQPPTPELDAILSATTTISSHLSSRSSSLDSILILVEWDLPYIVSEENTASTNVACWFSAAEMCLPHSCIATRTARTLRELPLKHLLYFGVMSQRSDAFLCCVCAGHYLKTTVSLSPHFLLWANMSIYIVAFKPVARQRQWNKQPYNSRC